jgi:uncharacterized membrane protein/protein-disulfide isomerase
MLNNDASSKPTARAGLTILILIGVFAAFGFFLCFAQIGAYSGNTKGLSASSWLCGSQDTFEYGCSGVFASRYGKVMGVPLPFFGSLYFLAVILWLFIFRRDALNMFFGVLMGMGAVISLGLVYVLFFVLPGMCNWCLLIHLANALMILTALVGYVKQGRFFDFSFFGYRLTKAFLVLFVMLALLGATASFYFFYQTKGLKKAYLNIRLDPNYQECLYNAQEEREIPLQPNDHVLGSRSAPVKIVIYKDAQCQFCHQAWDMVYEIYRKFNLDQLPRVAIILRQYPLSNRCNSHMKVNMHPYACAAARAMEASAITGGAEAFWKYHEMLHKHHDELDKVPYVRFAEEIGLSRESFLAALDKAEIEDKIKIDADSLYELGYQAVPIVFINGRYVDGWQVEGFMEKIVQDQLKQSRWPAETQPTTQP